MIDKEGIEKTIAETCLKMTCIISCDPSNIDLTVFSGVFFQDNGRYCVLTAKHCLEDIQKPHTLSLSNYGAQTLNAKFVYLKDFEVKSGLAKTDVDIAVIELSPDYAQKLNAEWVSRERIHEIVSVGDAVYVVGFPKAMIKRNALDNRFVHPAPYAAFTMIADPPPSESAMNPVDDSVDFFVHFEGSTDSKEHKQPFNPGGMSGCGIFTFDPIPRDPGRLWVPNIRLVGIQSSVFQKRFLRGKKALLALQEIDKRTIGPNRS